MASEARAARAAEAVTPAIANRPRPAGRWLRPERTGWMAARMARPGGVVAMSLWVAFWAKAWARGILPRSWFSMIRSAIRDETGASWLKRWGFWRVKDLS